MRCNLCTFGSPHPAAQSLCPHLQYCHSFFAAFYDSLLAKLMVHAPEGRPTAIAKLQAALDETQVGVPVQGSRRVTGSISCTHGMFIAR